MINSLKPLHHKLIGDPRSTLLQARIFHQICTIVLVFTPIGIGINFFTEIPYVTFALFCTFSITAILYYNSRVRGKLKSSSLFFVLSANALLIGNYFVNSGINGPTTVLYILSLIFTIAIMPGRQSLYWLALNIVSVMALMLMDYNMPGFIKNSYTDRTKQYMDIAFTYLSCAVCGVVVLLYILSNYRREKNAAGRASRELKEANDSKTLLLSILSHDLKSPLNSIQGYLELLIEYDLEEEEKKSIQASLLLETKNTQAMLFNLLSWTKSQMDGAVSPNLEQVNLHEALKGSLEMHQATAREKAISIRNEIESDLAIHADLEMLKLVVRNLVNNAIKFTHPGGEISIRTKITSGEIVLSVADNGIGISPEKQNKLFALNSVATYGTNKEKGVGLGLLLCKEFTELQGGRISFESTPDQGTIFHLHFRTSPSSDTSTNEKENISG